MSSKHRRHHHHKSKHRSAKRHKIYLENCLYVRKKYVTTKHLDAFTYKFMEKTYDEMFGEYVNIERQYRSYKMVKRDGHRYVAFNCGDLGKVRDVFKDFEIVDRRVKPKLNFKLKYTAKLKSGEQTDITNFWLDKKGYGIIHAPVRWGKTYVSGYLICNLGTTTLLLMDKKHLCAQWIKDLREKNKETGLYMTNIKELEHKTGKKILGMFKKVGKKKYKTYPITVATFQSIWSAEKRSQFISKNRDRFGFVWVDECHHSPAYTYAKSILKWNAKHKGGVSGSVKRRDNKHLLMHDIIGPVTSEGSTEQMPCKVIKHMTDYTVNPKAPWTWMVSAVVGNEELNEDVAKVVAKEARKGKFVLVHTEREKHTYNLKKKIQEYDPNLAVEVLHGNVKIEERNRIIQDMNKKKVNVIIGARVMQEGITFARADTLHIGFSPVTQEELIKQISGRIRTPMPGKRTPVIHDWRLKGHGGLYASGRSRDNYWNKMKWEVDVLYETGKTYGDDKDDSYKMPRICGNCKSFFKCKSKDSVKAKSEICKKYAEYTVKPREKLEIILANKDSLRLAGWYEKFVEDLKGRQDLYWSRKQLGVLERLYHDCLNNPDVKTREV